MNELSSANKTGFPCDCAKKKISVEIQEAGNFKYLIIVDRRILLRTPSYFIITISVYITFYDNKLRGLVFSLSLARRWSQKNCPGNTGNVAPNGCHFQDFLI